MDEQEWAAIVDDAQEELLTLSNVLTTAQVVLLIEEILNQPLKPEDRQHVAKLLAAHPSLVPAAAGSDLWERGTNPGTPKRNFIQMDRR